MGNKKVMVTGGSGFIGGYLVECLVAKGYFPLVFDNNSRGSFERLKHLQNRIDFFHGDIRNKKDVLNAAEGCHALFHLAFVNGTRFFYEKPELVLEVGTKGAINTLEAVQELGIKNYIMASSSEVYQQPTHVPTGEDERIMIPDIRNPRFSYSGGKIISELLTINYLRGSNIRHMIFRPHNVFGPRMGCEHVIPELVRKIGIASENFTKNECGIEIQGTGKETRAFCCVEDAVEQIITIFEKGESGEIYHVGMDKERTILELIQDLAGILKMQIDVMPGDLRTGGTSRRCPDISKVCVLGYEQNDHYLEGLKKTVEWYKNYYLTQSRKAAK